MNQSKIAVRYAKAFFELAIEKDSLEALKKDIETVFTYTSDKEIELMLESPVVKTSQKKLLLKKIFEKKVSELTVSFLMMIADNRREHHISAICRNFLDRYRAYKGIKAASITTAVAMDSALKDRFSKIIEEVFKTKVELETKEDSSLIGGFILRVGDEQLDTSIVNKLATVKRELLNANL